MRYSEELTFSLGRQMPDDTWTVCAVSDNDEFYLGWTQGQAGRPNRLAGHAELAQGVICLRAPNPLRLMSRAWYEVAHKPGYSGSPWVGVFRSRHPDTLFHFRMLSAREAAIMHLSRDNFYVVEIVDYTEPIHGDQSLTTSVPLHFDPSTVAHDYVERTVPELWTGPLFITANKYEANMHKRPEPYVDRSHDPVPVGDPLKTNAPSVGSSTRARAFRGTEMTWCCCRSFRPTRRSIRTGTSLSPGPPRLSAFRARTP
jgi:hypothetical protein